MTTSTLASINNKRTKVKRLREDRFCVFFAFLLSGFCFVAGLFFIYFCRALKVFYLQKSSHYIQTKHNKKFLLHRKRPCHNLGFSWFLSHSLSEITKEESIYINKYKCVVSVNVSILNG